MQINDESIREIERRLDEANREYEKIDPGINDDSVLEAERDTLEWVLGVINTARPEPSTFQRYIEQGTRAVRTHPDFDALADFTTSAVDTMASILHAMEYEAEHGKADDSFDVDEVLARVHRSYDGDFEDDGAPKRVERIMFRVGDTSNEAVYNDLGDPLCPVCQHDDVAMWADDGEADLADWFACQKHSGGCGVNGAVVYMADITKTLNGITVPDDDGKEA